MRSGSGRGLGASGAGGSRRFYCALYGLVSSCSFMKGMIVLGGRV